MAKASAAPEDMFTTEIADSVRAFLLAVRDCALSKDPDAIAHLLLQVSQLLLAGGRLGAIADVTPKQLFEPDAGYDADLEDVRVALAALLDPVDEYVEVFDPYDPDPELLDSRLSDDLTNVMLDLTHGLAHYERGDVDEALWWWQHSYVSTWGATASACLRALQAIILHARLASTEK